MSFHSLVMMKWLLKNTVKLIETLKTHPKTSIQTTYLQHFISPKVPQKYDSSLRAHIFVIAPNAKKNPFGDFDI